MKDNVGLLVGVILSVVFTEYYCFMAFRNSFRLSNKKNKIGIYVIYFFVNISIWLGIYWLRYVALYDFPKNVKAILLASLFGFVVSKMIMALMMLIADVIRLVRWVFRKLDKETMSRSKEEEKPIGVFSRATFISRTTLVLGGLTFGGFLWGTANRYRYQLIKIKLRIAGLPAALKGLKIVQISDIHTGSFDNPEAVKAGVDMVMAQNPDVILFTGDLVNDRTSELIPYKEIFAGLKAPLGVYSVLGNHDYGDYVKWPTAEDKEKNLQDLKDMQDQMGWKLLMNEHVILEKDGAQFALLGVENWSTNPRFPKHGRLDEAYKGLENTPLAFKMLLSHDPSHWDAEIKTKYKDIDLTLSGHTHGMQFGIELPWFRWSPAQYVYHHWAGLYQERNQYLYVNRGYGFLGFQGRIGILPEVTFIELE